MNTIHEDFKEINAKADTAKSVCDLINSHREIDFTSRRKMISIQKDLIRSLFYGFEKRYEYDVNQAGEYRTYCDTICHKLFSM